jgi:chromosome segregation ATPase
MDSAMNDVKQSMLNLLSEENEQLATALQEKVEELEYKNEFYLNDIQKLSDTNDELQSEIAELNEEVDVLLTENHELMVDAQNARKSFTGLQIAVSVLVFVYGMLYGVVLCPK